MWGPYYGYVQLEIMKTKLEIITKASSKSVSSTESSTESK